MLKQIETQLKTLSVNSKPLFRTVKGALEFSALKNRSIPNECCAFILPINNKPKKGVLHSSGTLQERQIQFGVVIGLKMINGRNGQDYSEIESTANEVVKVVAGFVPTGYTKQIVRGEAKLLAIVDNGVWWIEQFTLDYNEERNYGQKSK